MGDLGYVALEVKSLLVRIASIHIHIYLMQPKYIYVDKVLQSRYLPLDLTLVVWNYLHCLSSQYTIMLLTQVRVQ